jgi:alpha-mannosidase
MPTHIISHTHWDREWYLTFEQFRLRLVGLVDRLLDLMESQPDYRYFHLDGQTIVLEDYLELRPENETRLRRLIAEGRILIGPWYDMPDEFLVSGESLVRNLARGHRLASQYGSSMPVGYLPDLFGHVGQMPQILRNFGLDNAILWRGFGGRRAEYWWESPDGSRVLMMHLPPEGYCNATRVHLNPGLMLERATRAIKTEEQRTSVGEVLLMNGVDHVEPHAIIPQLARQLTETLGSSVSQSTLPAYVDAVRNGVHRNEGTRPLDTVRGELRSGEEYANLLPGVLSARVYLKQANARVQSLLEKHAEPMATWAWMLGAPYPAGELRYAWKTLLQNHPHDSICGCSVDPVHEENVTRFQRAEQVARGIVDQAGAVIARAVSAGPENAIRLVAVNTTYRPFSGTVVATLDVPYESDEPRRIVDLEALDAPVRFWSRDARLVAVRTGDGEQRPIQVLEEDKLARSLVMSRRETPWILRARRLRIAFQGDVPACGYSTFDIILDEVAEVTEPPGEEVAADRGMPAGEIIVGDRWAQNAFVRIAVNDDGTVDVLDRRSGVQYAQCGELEDTGDVGDEYTYSPPPLNPRFGSEDAENVHVSRVSAGPQRAEFRINYVLRLPESAAEDRSTRSASTAETLVSALVGIDAGSPRVSWQVSISNRSKDHRLRMLFPIGTETVSDVRAETAFGVAVRPARRKVPVENPCEIPVSYHPTASFTEAGSATAGAILLGEGLMEYEAVPDEEGRASRLALTLLRSVGYLSRDDLSMRPSGHAGPGLETPGAQCLGTYEFR